MSDRFIIEIRRSTNNGGVTFIEHTGDLILGTTDPIEAVALRKTLREALVGYDIALFEETTERRGVITAMDEDYFRNKAKAERAARFDTPDKAQALAWAALSTLDNHLTGDRALTRASRESVTEVLDYYGLGTLTARAKAKDGTADDNVLPYLVLALSTLCRGFPTPYRDAVDTQRWIAVCRSLAEHNPNSIPTTDIKACEREAIMDYEACEGRVISVRFVNGYDLGTNDSNDQVAGADEPPYRVIVCAMDDIDRQWCDDDLDPKWDVRPAADETRLDGLRSLWTFGRSYKVAETAKTEG